MKLISYLCVDLNKDFGNFGTINHGWLAIVALIHLQAHAGVYDPPTSMEGWDPETMIDVAGNGSLKMGKS